MIIAVRGNDWEGTVVHLPPPSATSFRGTALLADMSTSVGPATFLFSPVPVPDNLWNTRYLSAAADFLAARGEPVPEGAWAHVSPLHWDHVNLVGRYDFDEQAIADELRPLRGGNGN